ncbi:MAG TPA: hypothetical protein VK811_10690 [Candidatus Acidoferrum sp.]|jgi:hypothetical protein|nr:hypothetical protein [Candidatus Acidoferrum sp.]
MKRAIHFACLLALGALALAGCAKKSARDFVRDPAIKAQLTSFAAEKESQAQSLASAGGKKLPPEFAAFFSAAENLDWEEASHEYAELRKRLHNDTTLYGSWWQPVLETFGAAGQFALGDEKYAAAFGNNIIQSIPPGSIYFGGTDPGRFIVTAMEKSQIKGDPFFGLTQNTLTDDSYLDYLRSMYRDKIYIPTAADSQKCFASYYRDFQKRQAMHQLQPGESVTNGPDGKMKVNSQISLVQVRDLLSREVFNQNTGREFYVEESFPLQWMYPYLEPHGLIFKLNHQPLTKLSDGLVQQDHAYWTKTVSPMIGDWLNDNTALSNIAAFAEKVYLHHDFSGFTGDPAFVENAYSHQMFCEERLSIAGLYAWRAQHDPDAAARQRMAAAADFAFRQAWALCPYSPEAVLGYVQFLMSEKRISDALVVAETAAEFPSGPTAGMINQLISNLKRYQQQGK